MAIKYFGEDRIKQLLTLVKGQLDLKATPEQINTAVDAVATRVGATESEITAIKEAIQDVVKSGDLDSLKSELEKKISDAVKAHDESDAAHAALFKAHTDAIKVNTDAITTLNGTGEGSVDKKITDAFNDFATKVTDDGVVNSYKELIDWAAEHGSDATEMAAAISKLEAIVDGIGGTEEKPTVVAYVQDAIEALKIGDYAKAAELTALAERVSTVEGKAHEHTNKNVLDTITQSMVDSWNEANTEYTDTEVKAMWDSVFGE